jgi:hypothetical protein
MQKSGELVWRPFVSGRISKPMDWAMILLNSVRRLSSAFRGVHGHSSKTDFAADRTAMAGYGFCKEVSAGHRLGRIIRETSNRYCTCQGRAMVGG